MKKLFSHFIMLFLLVAAIGCSPIVSEEDSEPAEEKQQTEVPQEEESEDDEVTIEAEDDDLKYIANHEVAKENVLRMIPEHFIEEARSNFVVAYQHTSHGTHVTRGMYGLPDYKEGDDVLFAVSRDERVDDELVILDNELQDYAEPGVSTADLSTNETGFEQTTRNFLEAPENADVNVIMWSWCNIAGHDVENNYLPAMARLVEDYGEGSSLIGEGEGQREKAVHFILMTGHANAGNNVGEGKPKNQAELINGFCEENKLFCLDYYGIDTHDMDDNYWEDAGDNGQSAIYGGNFYEDWQNNHEPGEDYWLNRYSPGGDEAYGAHNSQHITANRKAMAMWWILARLAGWDGLPIVSSTKH